LASRLAAVLLTPEAPYPAVGGGPLRTAGLVEYLARRAELDVVVFREAGAPDPRTGRLRELARRIIVIELPTHSRSHRARVGRNLVRLLLGVPPLVDRFARFEQQIAERLGESRYELGVVEHFCCAPYAALLARRVKRLVLDMHNVESVWHERCSKIEPWPVSVAHRRFAECCRRLERRWLPKYWRLLVASEADAKLVQAIAPGLKACVYPNSIPHRQAPVRHEEEAIAFTGNMEYLPNIAAVRYFARDVWPRLRDRWPRLEWWLVGKRPEAIERYTRGVAGTRIWGEVEDAVQVLARAKAAVVPLQAGSGTRLKILEAWAAATPVVSTSLGAEGLAGLAGEHLVIADTPQALLEAVSALVASPALRKRIGQAGRALYEREYTWEAGWRRLEQCLPLPQL